MAADALGDRGSSLAPTTVEALGDRAIRFARPAHVSARALVDAIRRWPGVVDVVVASEDVGVYYDRETVVGGGEDAGISVDRMAIVGTGEEAGVSVERVAIVGAGEEAGVSVERVALVDVAGIAALAALTDEAPPGREHVLRVVYDGPDLDDVARASGLSRDGVIARHVGGAYTVDTMGFAPGFAYLNGLDPALHLPRRATPRTRVPAGSLAIAGAQTAVYPFDSPGGWHVIGHVVDTRMFDDRGPLLALGDLVRFQR